MNVPGNISIFMRNDRFKFRSSRRVQMSERTKQWSCDTVDISAVSTRTKGECISSLLRNRGEP